MHDPMVLVFSIRRPWPKVRRMKQPRRQQPGRKVTLRSVWRSFRSPFWRFGRTELYWPSLIDVWHVEPDGHDAFTVCRKRITVDDYRASSRLRLDPRVKHRRVTRQAADEAALGYREWILDNRWRWHVRHWSVRFIPWLTFSRWARSRCAHCGRRFRWGEAPTSHQWGGDGPSLRKGEPGVYHSHCSSAVHTQRTKKNVEESYVRVLRRFQALLDWSDGDLLAELYQRPARPDGYGIAGDAHVVNRLLGWEFDHDKAVGSDAYELVHNDTGRRTQPHHHPLPANATLTTGERIRATHAEHVARYDR